MKRVPLSTTYDGAVLTGEIEVMQGGVCVRMSAPYPGLLRRRMMRTSPLQSEAQCRLTGRTLLEQLYVEAKAIADHRAAYEEVAQVAVRERALWQREADKLRKRQQALQAANSRGEVALEDYIARHAALDAEVVSRKQAYARTVWEACTAAGVKAVDPQLLIEVIALQGAD